MQVLEAGSHKYLLLELDPEFVANIARQTGFEFKIEDGRKFCRSICWRLNGRLLCCCLTQRTRGTLVGFHDANFMWMGARDPYCRRRSASQTRETEAGVHCPMR